jgi:hypothetical protein
VLRERIDPLEDQVAVSTATALGHLGNDPVRLLQVPPDEWQHGASPPPPPTATPASPATVDRVAIEQRQGESCQSAELLVGLRVLSPYESVLQPLTQ